MSKQREAWKEAAWVFTMSRLVIILISVFSVGFFSASIHNLDRACKTIPICIFYHWDSVHYVHIAVNGYRSLADTGFFPLWPMFVHVLGLLFGGQDPESYIIASLVLANICFYFALVLLYYLVSEEFELSTARRALYYFALSPFSFFFFLGYTESLFVLLCIAVFLLLRHQKMWAWACAGLLGMLATLSRSSGLALAVPFVMIALHNLVMFYSGRDKQTQWWHTLLRFTPVLLIPLGLLAYMLYLWNTKGDPFIYSTQEAVVWKRHLSLPWQGIQFAMQFIFDPKSDIWTRTQNLLDILFTLVPLAILGLGWRRIPLRYALFSVALAFFALSFPIYYIEPLTSLPRYLLVAFPITIICAVWGKHPRFDSFYMALALPLFGMVTLMFLVAYWVA